MLQPKILVLEAMEAYRLKLTYATGEVKLFDVSPYITGSWFGALGDKSYFKSVRILPEGNGIEWPQGQDIAPHELYNFGVSLK
jgi:hypothetical protein